MWPVAEAAIDHVLEFQATTGEVAWRADDPADGALLTGSSSIHMSLRCALAIAARLGVHRPDWELSLGALGAAIAQRPDLFLDKSRWAMDWYYPILGGVLRGPAALARVDEHWDAFVVGGLGVRCVSDRPWITAAETCELVMALDAIGETDRARELFAWAQFLRHEDGSYWCGMNFEGERFDGPGAYFTADQPTWNSAAVVLAAHARRGRADRRAVPRRGTAGRRALGLGPHPARRAVRRGPAWGPTVGGQGRRRMRRLPVVPGTPAASAGVKPSATARCQTTKGACPPSAGSSNTSWMASRPSGSTNRAQAS